ncbi:LuxR C-terminal-related transcriptional regulator [Rhodococcus sp. SORGH_AS_0301]|uniref:ATP-binding protein n=1 Tax=Rhodococcus sp. SORGH_AS_0301 TaxID=3041780 RepID=UPI0027860905|nr:LuxR C-terminal-related transcriptional regulator [Rhodococcus sp. SORGH_AS_0301]MDQ1178620.1 putative ATPase/DNA-binding CsgD family transcriptional regulator [Rhodococcus sp. SORGH_AS_0301]
MTEILRLHAATSFIGRRDEMSGVRRLLEQARLVTLLGPGGVGKTRLAAEIADRLSRSFQDRVYWVDLSSVRRCESVVATAAAAMSLRVSPGGDPRAQLLGHLRERHALVVLDNCEHLLDILADLVTAMMDVAPDVRVLATSREPLGVSGEHCYFVPPLDTPGVVAGGTVIDIATHDAVALLVDRARAVAPHFELTDSNADDVAKLCTDLDGIPLAIELAAARLRSLSAAQVVERLNRRFGLLTMGGRNVVPRQKTLRTVIQWSFDLCSEPERRLWARLAVFPGRFDIDAVEAICGFGDLPRDQILDLMDCLVAKSVVDVVESGRTVRYRQLTTLREYGSLRLVESGEAEQVRRRHRDYFLGMAAQAAEPASWFGAGQSELAARWRTEHDNLIAAVDWSIQIRDLTPAAELVVALRYHWIADGDLDGARGWLDRVSAALGDESSARGDVLWVTAWVALLQGDREGAAACLRECRDIGERTSNAVLLAHCDHFTGLRALFSGHTSEAIDHFAQAIEGHRRTGDPAATLIAMMQLAIAQIYDGRPDDGLKTCADLTAQAGQYGERWVNAYTSWVSSVAYFHLDDLDAATERARAALRAQRDLMDRICTALSLEVLAWCAERRRENRRAADLFNSAQSAWDGLGTSIAAFGPHIRRDSVRARERVESALRRPLPVNSRGKDWTVETVEHAIDVALDEVPVPATASPEKPSVLTRRELEVAALVAQGLTNRQIAASLIISHRTVEGHLERIMAKLEFRSRAQVGAWVERERARRTQTALA